MRALCAILNPRKPNAANAVMMTNILNPKTITGAPLDWLIGGSPLLEGVWGALGARRGAIVSVERVREGAFWVANRLYGITFTPLSDVPVYHPEVRAYEVIK